MQTFDETFASVAASLPDHALMQRDEALALACMTDFMREAEHAFFAIPPTGPDGT